MNIPSDATEFEAFLLKMGQESHGKVPSTPEQFFARSVKGWGTTSKGKVTSLYIGGRNYSLNKAIAFTQREWEFHCAATAKRFRAINSTYDYEKFDRLRDEICSTAQYLGNTIQGSLYYAYRNGDVTDYYCRMSFTQMQWIGTELPEALLKLSKPNLVTA